VIFILAHLYGISTFVNAYVTLWCSSRVMSHSHIKRSTSLLMCLICSSINIHQGLCSIVTFLKGVRLWDFVMVMLHCVIHLCWLIGEYKIMMVSHDMLVAMQTWKNNNPLTWRDDSRYFHNEFEYGVKRWNVENWIRFLNIEFLLIVFLVDYVKFEFL
jgi:hypothetical protein